MTRLSVNINKVATIRNARGGNIPDVIYCAQQCESYGADGITVHPRPDERHIKYSDVQALKPLIKTELNIEGYPDQSFIDLIMEVKPHQVTLVPDAPDVLTSNAGWDALTQKDFLTRIIQVIKPFCSRVSLFMEPELDQIKAAKECGADTIELYTEEFALAYSKGNMHAVKPYAKAASYAATMDLGVNAGHDLNLSNLAFFVKNVQPLDEVSIGHALISDALYVGLQNAIQMYKREINKGFGLL